MISGIYVINSAGLKLYSKIFDSKIDVDDVLLMSFLSAIQMYAETMIDETIQSIELEGIHIIYRLPDKKYTGGIMIVIVAQLINSVILLKAGHIIDLIRKELIKENDFSTSILEMENYSKEIAYIEKKIDQIINLNDEDLEALSKEEHVFRLERILNDLGKRVPSKTLQVDPRIYLTEKKLFRVDPSISAQETDVIINKLRTTISRLFGQKVFDDIISRM